MPPKGGRESNLNPSAIFARQAGVNTSGGRYLIAGIRPNDWFSPLQPLTPMAPPDVSGRRWDYDVGYNINTTPRHDAAVSYGQLRALANNCDILRIVIETRKDQIAAQKWRIKPVDGTNAPEDGDQAKALTKFFAQPSRDWDFDEWLRQIMEDLLVLDAVAVYKWKRNNKQLYSLDPLDASTIKLLIDSSGRRPAPPSPAYQQILKGIQAVDYMAARDPAFDASRVGADEEVKVEEFGLDELIYKARNVRTWTPYGYGPVEQIITTVNISIRRAMHQLAYYSDGNMNDALIGLPEGWNMKAIREFQDYWDSVNKGNLKERRMGKFVPGDFKYQKVIEPALKDEYDEWLARIICFCFSITPTPFIKQVNRATADSQHDTALEEGLAPLNNWIQKFINKIIVADFGITDYEFSWVDDKEQDMVAKAQADEIYVKIGVLDQNEVRETLGREHRPEANKLGIVTGTGFMPLQMEYPDPMDAAAAQNAAVGGAVGPDGGDQTKGGGKAAPKAAKTAPDDNPDDDDPNDGEKAQKSASGGDLKKNFTGLSLSRPIVTHAKANATKKIKHVLDETKASVLHQIRHGRQALGKDAGDDGGDDIPLRLDLSTLQGVGPAIRDDLANVASDAGKITVGTLNINDETGLFDQVNVRAGVWADARSAELVTLITDSTRIELRAKIGAAIDDNIGIDKFSEELSGWSGFSEDRAALIANTEVGNANGQGALEGLKSARDIGISVKKQWLEDDEACPICQENADAGPIDLDDDFPSGDDAPLAHPRCECTMIGITADD